MDVLKDIVFPQSPTNILLLKYLLFLTLLILLPYLSVLLSTTLFSAMHFNKGKSTGNRDYLVFANELIDMFTANKVMSISLGLIPLLSIIFILGQLLLNSSLNVTSHLFFAFIIFVAALIYLYTYKHSYKLKNIFNLVNVSETTSKDLVSEFEGLKESNSKLLSKSGIIGFILLAVVSYILISVLQIVSDSTRWASENSFFDILISANSFLYFLFYLSFSFSITCAAIMFKFFKSGQKAYSENYLNYVKTFSLKTGLIFTFIQPLLFVLTVISSPKSALSFQIFIAGAIILALMLIISVMFYIMYKESKTNLGGSAVLVFLILISVIIYKDQLAFDTASQKQMLNINNEYNLYAAHIKEKAGILEVIEISGEDIYNAKCIACHKFDAVLVGPAYNDVLPKYDGKREDLISFILNPKKINPDFTAMPNQGLKPKEAEAIADYIVKIYNESK
ncbi:MAG: cytochrome c [Melioribacteraceae bacterium]|nr:cytochrome c [Melioribacteraceae bacterium]